MQGFHDCLYDLKEKYNQQEIKNFLQIQEIDNFKEEIKKNK